MFLQPGLRDHDDVADVEHGVLVGRRIVEGRRAYPDAAAKTRGIDPVEQQVGRPGRRRRPVGHDERVTAGTAVGDLDGDRGDPTRLGNAPRFGGVGRDAAGTGELAVVLVDVPEQEHEAQPGETDLAFHEVHREVSGGLGVAAADAGPALALERREHLIHDDDRDQTEHEPDQNFDEREAAH